MSLSRSSMVLSVLTVAGLAPPQVPTGAVAPTEHIVQIRVVDERGKPARDAEVAYMWVLNVGKVAPVKNGAQARTDAEGSATVRLNVSQAISLIAFNKARNLAGQAWFDPKTPKDVTIMLKPVAKLSMNVAIKDWQGDIPEGSFNFMSIGANKTTSIAGFSEATKNTEVLVPAGDYAFFMYSDFTTSYSSKETLTLKPGDVRTIGSISVEMTGLGRSLGREALPIKTTAARGLEKPFNMADYRGKWVILEFWGFW